MSRAHERLVEFIGTHFDGLSTKDQRTAIFALCDVGSPAAVSLLERISADAKYEVTFSDATPTSLQTVREAAAHQLRRLGCASAIDGILDEFANGPSGRAEFDLMGMDRQAVVSAVQARLESADPPLLKELLQLLGWFGDESVLPSVRAFLDHRCADVADVAFEAEQRLLGLD